MCGPLSTCRRSSLVLFALALLPALHAATAEEAAEAEAKEPAIEPEAAEIMRAVAERLAKAPALQVGVRASWEVIQRSGVRLEFGDELTLYAKRPDHFAAVAAGWDVTYHGCGDTWYERRMQGGEVVNVVVGPPPGY